MRISLLGIPLTLHKAHDEVKNIDIRVEVPVLDYQVLIGNQLITVTQALPRV